MPPPLNDKDYFELSHQEDGVINHRLSWLLAGQPLLFLAYMNGMGQHQITDEGLKKHIEAAMLWIPRVGFVMSLAILIGVLGAVIAILKLAARREASERGQRAPAGVSTLTTLLGLVPALAIPSALLVAWYHLR